VEFKAAWGAEITRRLVERAIKTAGSIKKAGTLLRVYAVAEAEPRRYTKFRSDVGRLRGT
jgi:hypothetical protein